MDSKIFLNINQEAGREVHLPGETNSFNSDASLFGTYDDDTNPPSKYYQTSNGQPWALLIPGMWKYPKEFSDITTAYKRFDDYVQSNSSLVWYTDTEENQELSDIYNK